MLGDTAIAVNPNDKRYKLIGKTALLPLVGSIPIIADNMVDPEFGTAVLKLHPALNELMNR